MLSRLYVILPTMLVSLQLCVQAQATGIQWQNTVGGIGHDYLNAIAYTSDGGVIAGGYSESDMNSDKSEDNIGRDDYWIVKFDDTGAIEWDNTIGGAGYDRLYALEETPDGGFILGGTSPSPGGFGDKSESSLGGNDYWVVKINASGVVEWDNTIGGTGNDDLFCVQPTSDGGYILAGTTESGIGGDKTENKVGNSDYWVVKLDATGDIVWQNDIGGLLYETLYSAYETLDGGYILAGISTSGIGGDKSEPHFGGYDYWIVKLNALGNIVWEKTFGSLGNDQAYSAIPTVDGGSIVIGLSDGGLTGNKTEATNGFQDFWLIKLDNDGSITWQNSIGGTGAENLFVNAGVQEPNGNYLIGGYSQSGIGGDVTETNAGSWDYWVIRLNPSGSIIWQSVIGGASGDFANAIDYAPDGGFVVAGHSYSNISGEKTENTNGDADYWVVRYEGGCIPATEICNAIDDDCDGTADEDIEIYAVVIPDGATTFCQGGSVLLSAEYTGDEVQWTRNGIIIPGATSTVYTATKKGLYAVTTSNACATATSPGIIIVVNKNPNAIITADGPTTFCMGSSVVLSVNPVGGCIYQWYKGPTPIAGATSLNYTATTTGNYKCRVTKTATGCFKNSNAIAVSVPCREGMYAGEAEEADAVLNKLSVYPNPAHQFITIESSFMLPADIQIRTISGQLIAQQVMHSGTSELDISAWPSGVYYLQSTTEKDIIVTQFIKQ